MTFDPKLYALSIKIYITQPKKFQDCFSIIGYGTLIHLGKILLQYWWCGGSRINAVTWH